MPENDLDRQKMGEIEAMLKQWRDRGVKLFMISKKDKMGREWFRKKVKVDFEFLYSFIFRYRLSAALVQ